MLCYRRFLFSFFWDIFFGVIEMFVYTEIMCEYIRFLYIFCYEKVDIEGNILLILLMKVVLFFYYLNVLINVSLRVLCFDFFRFFLNL